METDFFKADSRNLPRVDAAMVSDFFINNADFYSAEMQNVKTAFVARESYGDDAVGYVQLRRSGSKCTIKCQMCPEHSVRNKAYPVTIEIDEKEEKVTGCDCQGCAASAGGCKHAVAFLLWLHRRTEEPSATSVSCYWQKPILSRVGSTIKFIKVKEITSRVSAEMPTSSSVFEEFLRESTLRTLGNCELINFQPTHMVTGISKFSLHYFRHYDRASFASADEFIEALRNELTEKDIFQIESETRLQSECCFWYEMRYGRITASKAYEASRCKTLNGSLVAAIMGAKTIDTIAMKRGRSLESSVKTFLENKLGYKIENTGVFIIEEYPMIAATPDGIWRDVVIEIKCPTTKKTINNYIKNGAVTQKYYAQIQLQMYAAKKSKAYFCVADPNFESNSIVTIVVVDLDKEYCLELFQTLRSFWIRNIYPLLDRVLKV